MLIVECCEEDYTFELASLVYFIFICIYILSFLFVLHEVFKYKKYLKLF